MRDVPPSRCSQSEGVRTGVLCEGALHALCDTRGSWGRSGDVRSLVKSWVNPDVLQHGFPGGEVRDPLPFASPAMSLVRSGKRCRRRDPCRFTLSTQKNVIFGHFAKMMTGRSQICM
jgi:hypothetical protein